MSNSAIAGNIQSANPTLQQTHIKQASPNFAFTQKAPLELSVLLGGSYIPNTIKGQTLQLLPYEIGPNADTFTAQHGSGAFTWGVEAKYRFKFHESGTQGYFINAIGAGIQVFQITDFNQTGHVLQFNLPEFENYTYKLKLINTRVMADFDIDFQPIWLNFIPFVEGGIGVANTKISYESAPIPPLDGPTFQLPEKSSWHFAYQAGAGM
jgi:opacity protein-like surface antigen